MQITTGWPLIFLAALVVFIDSIGFGVVVPVLPIYAEELGVSEFMNGFLFATYAIALLATAIPMGMLSDRLGRKPFILFGMFAMSAAFVFYALARTYWVLVIARILDGATAAATWSAALAVVGDRLEESRMGAMMGYIMGAAAVGGIAGPLLGGALFDAAGYGAPFYTIAGACFVGGIISVFLKEDWSPSDRTSISGIEMLKPILRNKKIRLTCWIVLISTTGIGLLQPTLPLYLRDEFTMSPTEIGLVFGVMMVFFAVASPLAGKYSDIAGRRQPILVGLLATAAMAPFLAVFKNAVLLYVLMGLLGISFSLFETPTLPLITDALQEDDETQGGSLGTGFGLVNFFYSLGFAIGPLVGGAIMGWWGLLAAVGVYSVSLVVTSVIAVRGLPGRQA